MKSDAGKTRRPQKAVSGTTASFPCGTLSYLAECRGAKRKTVSPGWPAHQNELTKIIKK